MDTTADVLWDPEGRRQCIYRTRRVRKNGKFRNSQMIADDGDVIYCYVSDACNADAAAGLKTYQAK